MNKLVPIVCDIEASQHHVDCCFFGSFLTLSDCEVRATPELLRIAIVLFQKKKTAIVTKGLLRWLLRWAGLRTAGSLDNAPE